MHVDVSQTGAAAIRRSAVKSPLQLLISIAEADPTAGRERLFRTWLKQMMEADGADIALDEDGFLYACLRYTFTNHYATIEADARKAELQKQYQRTPVQRAQEQQKTQAKVASLVKEIQSVVLMDLILPSGKRLGDATFAECAKAGGWYIKIAKKGKPGQIVGKVLQESDLRAALGR